MEELEGGVQRRRQQSGEFGVEQRRIQRRSPHRPSATSAPHESPVIPRESLKEIP